METESPAGAQQAALTGDFGALYEAHARSVYYLALRLLGDPTSAEDAAHDVFLKAYRHRHQFRGESAVRTWLYRIALNHCQNLLSAWGRRAILPAADESVLDNAPAPTDSPLRVLEVKELGQRIQKTLDALPEEYRILLLLRADRGLSYEAMAEVTEQTVDMVRGKLFRARKAFAARFPKTA